MIRSTEIESDVVDIADPRFDREAAWRFIESSRPNPDPRHGAGLDEEEFSTTEKN